MSWEELVRRLVALLRQYAPDLVDSAPVGGTLCEIYGLPRCSPGRAPQVLLRVRVAGGEEECPLACEATSHLAGVVVLCAHVGPRLEVPAWFSDEITAMAALLLASGHASPPTEAR